MSQETAALQSIFQKNLLFVHGKGGVGKTSVSRALARALSQSKEKVLWLTLEDPLFPLGELKQESRNLWHLNADFSASFEEYAALKIGMAPLTRLFLKNKLIRYLAQAAPGIHELVLLGKIWHERESYTQVVVDLPSTGYGLAMFQSTQNFVKLFQGGPLNKDAQEMLRTFNDPKQTGHLILSLPEEMPLRESLELGEFLSQMLPGNPPAYLVNRLFPADSALESEAAENPSIDPSRNGSTPLATSPKDYVQKRISLEKANLKLWRETKIGNNYGELDYFLPQQGDDSRGELLVENLVSQLKNRGYL